MASGTVSKRDGRWRARYRHPERGTQHQATFERKTDAQRWLRRELEKIDSGLWIDGAAGKVTFEQFFESWSSRQVWTTNTQLAMSLAVRGTPFRSTALHRIRTTDVETWVKAMTVATETRPALAPGTIKTRFVNVRSVFRAAVRDQVIEADPSDGVRLPRQRKRAEALSIPTPDEVGRCLTAADERLRALVAVCALAGLRLGEAAGLKFGDVDYARRQLHVRRQVQRAGRKNVEIRMPKYGSERSVPMPDELAEILRHHERLGHVSDWLFAGGEDFPPHQNTIGHQWRLAQKRAGLSGIRLHDLRHFYASGLIADGCDVVTVQRALGHAKASTTLDTYVKLWPSGEDRTRRAASALAREVLADIAGRERAEEDSEDTK
jgi:integrase